MFKKNTVLDKLLQDNLSDLSERENITREEIQQGLIQGSTVLLGNPEHNAVTPLLIGQPAAVKVNANLGTSPFMNSPDLELSKLHTAAKAGAHTVMDLSTGGDLNQIRKDMLASTELPLGTVPLYSVAQKYIQDKKSPAQISRTEIFEEIAKQAEQGVDFMTLHCGVTQRAVELANRSERILGIVSRGGSLLARWMQENKQENPLYTDFDEILKICLEHNVVISLGDGLRPGAGQDAGDAAQWEEVIELSELAGIARKSEVQAMIEGPGHVPINRVQEQIQGIKRLCNNAPLYVLGPLTTDRAPGYDHIAGAIGGAMAAFYGADFLCYLTPSEHLTLPNENDVWQGVKASLLAAHSAEVGFNRRDAVEKNNCISQARKQLDWEKIASSALDPNMVQKRKENFASNSECAMCGEFCAVKLMQ